MDTQDDFDHDPDHHSDHGDVLLGAASGLAAGLVGALVMTGFQSLLARGGITSGVSGPPSTEKAADRAALLVTGHRVPRRQRPAAGESVHYAVGSLVGGAYGAAAERVPCVTAGKGAAFGVAAATVVDETLVPAFRFGDPLWRAPLRSHPYSYLSHLVFGTATEAARRGFRRFFGKVKAGVQMLQRRRATGLSSDEDAPIGSDADFGPDVAGIETPVTPRPRASRNTLVLAFMLGATAGPRTSAPLTVTSWAARLGWIDVKRSPLAFLGTTQGVCLTTPMAVGELIVDKLPSTPDRTQPVGVAARAATGALSGAALAGGRSVPAAVAGAAGAIVATYVGHAIRTRVARAIGHDAPIAVAEDALAFGGAALVCLASLAPDSAESTD